MVSHVALIRGINVGGRNSLPMKELAEILEGIGCSNVKTYIQSGNAVFHSRSPVAGLTREITPAIAGRRGFRPIGMVWKKSEFQQAIDDNPLSGHESDPRAQQACGKVRESPWGTDDSPQLEYGWQDHVNVE
jgi:uncharacterized protein (DUF1697 family)